MIVEAHSAVQQERLKADMNREIASLAVFERREPEFQQAQEKERERAITAQQKLREIASQELQERIQFERELARQQQKNVLLQKQNEIEQLEAQADKTLFQQKFENFVVAKETQAKEMDYNPNTGLPSPQSVVLNFLIPKLHRRVRIDRSWPVGHLPLLLTPMLYRKCQLQVQWSQRCQIFLVTWTLRIFV